MVSQCPDKMLGLNFIAMRKTTAILNGTTVNKGDSLWVPETVFTTDHEGLPFLTQYLRGTVWTVQHFEEYQGKIVVYFKEGGCCNLESFCKVGCNPLKCSCIAQARWNNEPQKLQ